MSIPLSAILVLCLMLAFCAACMEMPRPHALTQKECVGQSGGEWLFHECIWVRPGDPTWDAEYYRLEAT